MIDASTNTYLCSDYAGADSQEMTLELRALTLRYTIPTGKEAM